MRAPERVRHDYRRPARFRPSGRVVLVAAISLLAGLLGFAISSNRERVYTAESLVLLEGGGGGSSEVETYVATKADRVTTSDVLTAAVENLEGESAGVETAGELRSRISVDANPELLSLTIEARAATADDAAALANATAEAYETVEGEAATASVDLAQAELESAISRGASRGGRRRRHLADESRRSGRDRRTERRGQPAISAPGPTRRHRRPSRDCDVGNPRGSSRPSHRATRTRPDPSSTEP